MLDFFRHAGRATAIVLAALPVASVAVKNVWCRFLCPYGALLGLVSLVSPTRICCNAELCIDCAKCAKPQCCGDPRGSVG
jgi:polyferredoxin